MTEHSDGLESRIDDAFERAISQQVSEQREIKRLVAQVEDNLVALTSGYSDLATSMAEQAHATRSDMRQDYEGLDASIRAVLADMQAYKHDVNEDLVRAIADLNEAAANTRDTNGTVLQHAVVDVQKALASGNERTKSAIEALRTTLKGNTDDVVREVSDLNQTLRQSISQATQDQSAALAVSISTFKEDLQEQAKRDETLLRQAIGAIEDRMDYGQNRQQQQFEAAEQHLTDLLSTQEAARQAFAQELQEVVSVFTDDQTIRAQQIDALQRHITNMVQDVVSSSHNQFEVAIEALDKATANLHEDRDEGREDVTKSLATLQGVNEVATRRLQQMNDMIDELRSSTDGLEPVITKAVTDFSLRLQSQLAEQQTHTDTIAQRLETSSQTLHDAVKDSLTSATSTFSEQSSALQMAASEREQAALAGIEQAKGLLEQTAIVASERLDSQSQVNNETLREIAQSVEHVAQDALQSITYNITKATSELTDVQSTTLDAATTARTAMTEATKLLVKHIESLEPTIQTGLQQVVEHVEQLTSALNEDLRHTSSSATATMRDVAGDIRGQLVVLSHSLREEITQAEERSKAVAVDDRTRLERVTQELSQATGGAEAAMARLVEETRGHISSLRSDTLDALRSAADLIAQAGQAFPDHLDKSTLVFTEASQEAATAITQTIDHVQDAVANQLSDIAVASKTIIEQTDRSGGLFLDQITLLRQSIDQAVSDITKSSGDASSKWRLVMNETAQSLRNDMAQRMDLASSHLYEQANAITAAHQDGAARIESVSAQLLLQLDSVNLRLKDAVGEAHQSLAQQAIAERSRADDTLAMLSATVDDRVAGLEASVTTTREFLHGLHDDLSNTHRAAIEELTTNLQGVTKTLMEDVTTQSQKTADLTQHTLQSQVSQAVDNIATALHDAEMMAATHMSQTAQTITEAEEAYRRATARLEEVVDTSRREIERVVEQSATTLERRTSQVSDRMSDEVSANIETSLAEVKTQLAGQLERVSLREEAGITRLYEVSTRVEESLNGLDDNVSAALQHVMDYRTDPVNHVIDHVQTLQDAINAQQQAHAREMQAAIATMEARFEAKLDEARISAQQREEALLNRIDRLVTNSLDTVMANAVSQLSDRVADVVSKQDVVVAGQRNELARLSEQLVVNVRDAINHAVANVDDAIGTLAAAGQHQQAQLTAANQEAMRDLTQALADSQGREVDRLAQAAQLLTELTAKDRTAEQKRGNDVVAGVGQAINEISAATERLVGLDDRVASRVSRSLADLRNHLTDEVRAVTKELLSKGSQPAPSSGAVFAPAQPVSIPPSAAGRSPVVPLSTPKAESGRRSPVPARREPAVPTTTCPDCGFAARTLIGLSTHRRTCPDAR